MPWLSFHWHHKTTYVHTLRDFLRCPESIASGQGSVLRVWTFQRRSCITGMIGTLTTLMVRQKTLTELEENKQWQSFLHQSQQGSKLICPYRLLRNKIHFKLDNKRKTKSRLYIRF